MDRWDWRCTYLTLSEIGIGGGDYYHIIKAKGWFFFISQLEVRYMHIQPTVLESKLNQYRDKSSYQTDDNKTGVKINPPPHLLPRMAVPEPPSLFTLSLLSPQFLQEKNKIRHKTPTRSFFLFFFFFSFFLPQGFFFF